MAMIMIRGWITHLYVILTSQFPFKEQSFFLSATDDKHWPAQYFCVKLFVTKNYWLCALPTGNFISWTHFWLLNIFVVLKMQFSLDFFESFSKLWCKKWSSRWVILLLIVILSYDNWVWRNLWCLKINSGF